MAWNSLAHDKKTLYERFVTRLGSAISNYTQICDVVTTDTPNLQVSDIYGIGATPSRAAHRLAMVATPRPPTQTC